MFPSKETLYHEHPCRLIRLYPRRYASVKFKAFGASSWAAFPFIPVFASGSRTLCWSIKRKCIKLLPTQRRLWTSVCQCPGGIAIVTNCEPGALQCSQPPWFFPHTQAERSSFSGNFNHVCKYYVFQDKHFAWVGQGAERTLLSSPARILRDNEEGWQVGERKRARIWDSQV